MAKQEVYLTPEEMEFVIETFELMKPSELYMIKINKHGDLTMKGWELSDDEVA